MDEIYVIGGNHHNTLGVLRSLGYKGIMSTLILTGDEDNPYTKYSKYIKRLIEVKSDEDAIRVLITEKSNISHAIVIACSDGASSALDQHREELSSVYSLPGSDKQGKLTSLMDKEAMSELGRKVGFTVPTSWVVESGDDISGIEYPCITKPILSKDGHKSDIKVCHSPEELIEVIHGGSCYRYQVQKFIEKDFEYQLIGLSVSGGEDVIVPGFSRCIRPCPGTNTGFLHYESLNGFNAPLDLCRRFIKEIGYSGLFSIEFLRDKNGIDYFMEMNFRNDGNAICVTASGTNLPYIWCLACMNMDYKDKLRASGLKPVYVMPEFNDLRSFVVPRRISLIDWIKDIRRTDAFMEYDPTDRKPFFVELGNIAKRALKRI